MESDADLYNRWRAQQDGHAFALLARRHATLVTDVAYRIGGSRALAEDALQEALLALARDRTGRPAAVGVRAWLARLAISKARNARASEAARARRERRVGTAQAMRPMNEQQQEASVHLERTLARLSGDDAAVLSLRFIHALPYAELAAILELAEPTARVRVHRALERARAASSDPGVDPSRLGAALSGLVPVAVSEEVVAAATERAVQAAPSPRAFARPRSMASSGVPMVVVVVLLLLVVVTAGLLLGGPEDDGVRGGATEAVTHRPGAPGLRGRPAVARSSVETRGRLVQPRGAVGTASSKVVSSSRDAGPHTETADVGTTLHPVVVRMQLALDDGTREVIRIATVAMRGQAVSGQYLEEHPGALRVRPGWALVISTDDPRVATPAVRLFVPDPVPQHLTIDVPAKADPRLDHLTLEIVDASTGQALPGAELHWGSPHARTPIQRADEAGRIVLDFSTQEDTPRESRAALLKFVSREHTIEAAGYQPAGWVWGLREFVPAVDAHDLDHWLRDGVVRVALTPTPQGERRHERTVRLLDSAGEPLVNAYVLAVHPTRRGGRGPVDPLLGVDGGFRRTDEMGRVRFAMGEVVALVLSIDRVQVAAWGLHRDGWPATGPRELRVPEFSHVNFEIRGLPASGTWRRDRKRPLRSRGTPPLLEGRLDVRAQAFLDEQGAILRVPDLAQGRLSAPTSSFRLQLDAHRSHSLHLFAGNKHRVLHVQPAPAGERQVLAHWAELAIAK